MPAASSKPTPQNLDSEGQDPIKLLMGALEKKSRNLEKRKTKLEGYKEMVSDGKTLNKDQQEAVSHFEEVQGNLQFAREFLVTIQAVVNETSKAKKKQERREVLLRQEGDQRRLQHVLLLQNVLNQMGQDHIRNDFLSGTNGAEQLEEQDLAFLDELYPLVSPSREDEAEEETVVNGEETTPKGKSSFDEKLSQAAVHLDKFLKGDESEVCGTTYKYLLELVLRIHKCGYLDDIPEAPTEKVVEPAVTPDDQPDPEPEDTPEFTPTEEEYRPPSVTSQTMPMGSTEPVTNYGQPGPVDTLSPQLVDDIPNPPEPIEMPPPKVSQPTYDVNEVIAPMEGGVTFFQESTVDVDSPHMDPAVIAVSLMTTQSYMTTPYQSNTDPSPMDLQGTPTHMEQPEPLSRPPSDSIYPSQPDPSIGGYSQNIYDPSQQSTLPPSHHPQASLPPIHPQHDYPSQQQQQQTQNLTPQGPQPGMGVHQGGMVSQQGYMDQAGFTPSQSGVSSGLGAPQGVPSQSEYGSTQQQQQSQDYSQVTMATLAGVRSQQQTTSGQLEEGSAVSGYSQVGGEMRDYRSSPIDQQLTKPEERQSASPSMYQQTSMQQASSQYSSSDITSNDGFGQTLQSSSQLGTETTAGGSGTPPPTIPFPPSNSNEQSSSAPKEDLDDSQQQPKSTMNAAAPPFQSSARTSPQMQQGLQTPSNEDSTFSSASSTQPGPESSQPSSSSKEQTDTRSSVEYRSSPPNIGVPSNAADNSSFQQYSSYNSNYQRNNRGGGRGGRGGPMGSPGYRNARGTPGMQFIRNPARFNNTSMQRGGYNAGYMPAARDTFQPRAPELGFHPQQGTYQAFTRPQDSSYYRGRGGINRGAPRGGRAWRE